MAQVKDVFYLHVRYYATAYLQNVAIAITHTTLSRDVKTKVARYFFALPTTQDFIPNEWITRNSAAR